MHLGRAALATVMPTDEQPDPSASSPLAAAPPADAVPAASAARAGRMPVAVHILGLSVFALGTSEFMLSGLLPAIAGDLDVSIPKAGLLVSAFAIGMVVGAPLLAVATLRLPRKATLLALLAAFGLGQVAGAVAPTYEVLFASRVVSALACAGFWALGASVAVAMVDRGSRARAMAVMIGGLSVANVLGVPAGAFLGDHFGWRSAFWAVGAASAVAFVGVLARVPHLPLPDRKPELRRELAVYRDRQVWLAVAFTACTAGGVFGAFSYLAPLLTDVAGLAPGWVPGVLALFGAGALLGTALGGRLADAHLFGVLLGGTAAATVLLALLGVFGGSPVVAVAVSFLVGVAAFFTAPALNARMFHVAGAAPTLAGATATASFNLGNTGGPWLGGLVIDAGLGYRATAWAGAAMTLVALALVAVALRLQSRERRTPSRVVMGAAAGAGVRGAVPDGASGGAAPRR